MVTKSTLVRLEKQKAALLQKDKDLYGFEEGIRFNDETPSRQYQIEVRFYPKRKWVIREITYDLKKNERMFGEWSELTKEFWDTLHPLRL